MAKYDALSGFLKSQMADQLPMTFQEIETVLGGKLPSSAHQYPAWWANDVTSHVQAKAWLNAGYETQQVDIAGKKLVFKRMAAPHLPHAGLGEPQHGFKHEAATPTLARHPMIGALKGWLTIEPGYDLTEPAMPEWADLIEEKFGAETHK